MSSELFRHLSACSLMLVLFAVFPALFCLWEVHLVSRRERRSHRRWVAAWLMATEAVEKNLWGKIIGFWRVIIIFFFILSFQMCLFLHIAQFPHSEE